MSYDLEIKLKEEKEPTVWERFVQWMNGDPDQRQRSGQQVPKTGTNTDILLSQTQKIKLKDAVESPNFERDSDTTSFVRRSDAGSDKSLII